MTTLTSLSTLEAIQQRRSVKHFDPNHQMSETEINQLVQLTLLSPTSFNIQNWRFVLVRNPELRAKIKAASWGQAQVTDASLLFVLCGDLNAWDKAPERYWRNAPEQVQAQLVPMIRQFYKDQPQLQRDEVHRSCGIAAQTLMLSAKSMGYDSCPMVGFDPQQVAELINLPNDHIISLLVVVGKALEPARERGGQLSQADVVIQDRFH